MAKGTTLAYGFLSTVVIGAFAFFLMVIQPQIRSIRNNAEQIEQTSTQLAEQQAFLSTIDQKLAQLQANQQHEKQLSLILPTDQRSEDYLRIMHQASGISGISIGRLTNQSSNLRNQLNTRIARGEITDLPGNIQPVGWQLEFSGTYQQFRAFLQELERAPRLLDILDISVGRSQADPNNVSGRMTTQFYQYIAAEDAQL